MKKTTISVYSVDKIHITLYSQNNTTVLKLINREFVYKEMKRDNYFYKNQYQVYTLNGTKIGTIQTNHSKYNNHLLVIDNSFFYSTPNWNNTIITLINTLQIDSYRVHEIHVCKDSNFNYKLQFDKGYSIIRENYKDPIYIANTRIIFDYDLLHSDKQKATENATVYIRNGKKKPTKTKQKQRTANKELSFYNKTDEIKSNGNYKTYILDYFDNFYSDIISTEKDVYRAEMRLSYSSLEFSNYKYELKKEYKQIDIIDNLLHKTEPLKPIISISPYNKLSKNDKEKYQKISIKSYYNIDLEKLNKQDYLERIFMHFQPFTDSITKKIYKQNIPEKINTNKIKNVIMNTTKPKVNRKEKENNELRILIAEALKNILQTTQDSTISIDEKNQLYDNLSVQLTDKTYFNNLFAGI